MYVLYIVYFIILVSRVNSHNSSVLLKERSDRYIDYKRVYHDIKSLTSSYVYWKGSPKYNKERIVENGLCNNIFPDLIVVPKSTNDVASIVKISRRYKVPLSIRSGGHSYICASIKNYGIHIDMRMFNKVQMTSRFPFGPPGPALCLGSGQTWARVLEIVPNGSHFKGLLYQRHDLWFPIPVRRGTLQ